MRFPGRPASRAASSRYAERRVEGVGPEAGEALHVGEVAHDPQRQALLGALLGDVETAAAGQADPQSQRPLARPGPGRGRRVPPLDPPAAGQVHHQPQVTRLYPEVLSPPGGGVDRPALAGISTGGA